MYKNKHQKVFINRDTRPEIIMDCTNFLVKIVKLKLFLIKLNKDDIMRFKIYFFKLYNNR